MANGKSGARPRLVAAGLMIVSAAFSAPLLAQWPLYPDPSVPKTADGAPDLEAPAPRTAQGTPDLSGIWENTWFHNGRIGQPPVSPPGEPPASTFSDVGAGFKEGLPLRPWAAALLKERREWNSKDNPGRALSADGPHAVPRAPAAPEDDPDAGRPSSSCTRGTPASGKSSPTGGRCRATTRNRGGTATRSGGGRAIRWSSRPIGFRDGGWLDIWGSPLTDAAKMTERFRRLNYGTLQIDVTIDDPKAYTRPFSVRVNQRLIARRRAHRIRLQREQPVSRSHGRQVAAVG